MKHFGLFGLWACLCAFAFACADEEDAKDAITRDSEPSNPYGDSATQDAATSDAATQDATSDAATQDATTDGSSSDASEDSGPKEECSVASECKGGSACQEPSCVKGKCEYYTLSGCCENENDCDHLTANACKKYVCESYDDYNRCAEKPDNGPDCCLDSNDCTDKDKPYCSQNGNECVQCQKTSQCTAPSSCQTVECVGGECKVSGEPCQCNQPSDCTVEDGCFEPTCEGNKCGSERKTDCCNEASPCPVILGKTATCSSNGKEAGTCHYETTEGWCTEDRDCAMSSIGKVCLTDEHRCVACNNNDDCYGNNACEWGHGLCNDHTCSYHTEGCCITPQDCVGNVECKQGQCQYPPNTVDWCRLQYPQETSIKKGESLNAYVRLYEEGVTGDNEPDNNMKVEFCWSPYQPLDATSSMDCAPMTFNTRFDRTSEPNHDEYMVVQPEGIKNLGIGQYAFFGKVSADGGQHWTLCDYDATQGNCKSGVCDDGANVFSPEHTGTLTVYSACGQCATRESKCSEDDRSIVTTPRYTCNEQTGNCEPDGSVVVFECESNQTCKIEYGLPTCKNNPTGCDGGCSDRNSCEPYMNGYYEEKGVCGSDNTCGHEAPVYRSCAKKPVCTGGTLTSYDNAACTTNIGVACVDSSSAFYCGSDRGQDCGQIDGVAPCTSGSCNSNADCDASSAANICRGGQCVKAVDWCRFQWAETKVPGYAVEGEEITAYLRLDMSNSGMMVAGSKTAVVKFAFAPQGTPISDRSKWIWTTPARRNEQFTDASAPTHSEYSLTFQAPRAGNYDLIGMVSTDCEFSYSGSVSDICAYWTPCDTNDGNGGDGSSNGYSSNNAWKLEVRAAE